MATARLRILETTDLHMQISGYDYLRDAPNPTQGLLHLAPVIAKMRSDGVATLLCDNGDFAQGTTLAESAIAAVAAGNTHPMIAAFNALEYDAVTLGNHEFDAGLPQLQDMLSQLHAPVVVANLRSDPTTHFVTPWTIIPRDLTCDDGKIRRIKVGVIGFVVPQTIDWNAHHLAGKLIADDIVDAAYTQVPALRRAGADIVVALCHAGIGTEHPRPRLENAAVPLAAVPGIDVVLAGHTHDRFPSPQFPPTAAIDPSDGRIHGKPTVMAGHDGQFLGVIDLHLQHRDGLWRIRDSWSALHAPAADLPAPDACAKISAAIATPHKFNRQQMNEQVTTSAHHLSSRFTMVGHDPTIALVAKAHQAAVSAMLANGPFANFPVLGAAASFRAGGHGGVNNFLDLSPGPLARRDVYAISPFNNPVCAVLRRGWQVQQWLEHAAGFFLRIPPGAQNAPLISTDFPSYQFDWLIGLTYQFDLSHPARFDRKGALLNPQAHRVRNILYKGRPIAEDDLFVVTTNVYRARGGGGYVPVPDADIIDVTQDGATTILQKALAQGGVPEPDGPNWRFARNAGATARFLSSPLGDAAPPADNIAQLGRADAGFDTYQIAF